MGTSGSELLVGVDIEFVSVMLGDRDGLGDGSPEKAARIPSNDRRREVTLKTE
jgi:hypothetical protein